LTGFETFPVGMLKATLSKVGTVWPFWMLPSLPPFFFEPGSIVYFFASAPNCASLVASCA
jgi:hypothetical protein